MSTVVGNSVTLSPELVRRCYDHCEQRVANYKSGRSSTELSMLGIELDPVRQAKSMMAECAFCLWCGGNIEKLNWEPKVDGGWDVVVPMLGKLVDVKQCGASGHCLCWPLKKNHLFCKKRFDLMVLVRVIEPDCEILGYVSKETFGRTHHIAPLGHWLMRGTWFLDANEDELLPPEGLNRWRRYVPATHPAYLELG